MSESANVTDGICQKIINFRKWINVRKEMLETNYVREGKFQNGQM